MTKVRLMFASDIHGDAYWCERLVEKYQESGARRLILLGDILYHGPRNPIPEHYNPKGVVALLNLLRDQILCVRGNCDAEVDQMLLNFPIMSEYAQLMTPLHTFFLTHGHHYSMEDLPPLSAGDVFVQGHTHIPVLRWKDGPIQDAGENCQRATTADTFLATVASAAKEAAGRNSEVNPAPRENAGDGVILLNPGSVSLPKNNSPHSFCIYEEMGERASFQLMDFEGKVFGELQA